MKTRYVTYAVLALAIAVLAAWLPWSGALAQVHAVAQAPEAAAQPAGGPQKGARYVIDPTHTFVMYEMGHYGTTTNRGRFSTQGRHRAHRPRRRRRQGRHHDGHEHRSTPASTCSTAMSRARIS